MPPVAMAPAAIPRPFTGAPAAAVPASAKKWSRFVKSVLVIVLGVAAYAGFLVWERRQPYEWSGIVEAKTASIGSRTGGRVKDVLVVEGQDVKAGTPIVLLEPGEVEAEKQIAESELEAAEASLEKLLNGARVEEVTQAMAKLAEARGGIAHAGAQAAQDRRELARAKELYGTGAISIAERDAKLAAAQSASGMYAEAAARANEAQATLKLLKVGTRPEEIRAAKAQVGIAKGRLSVAATRVDELTIRAPSDARIESVLVRPGDLLQPGASAAVLLEQKQLYVRIYVPETVIGKIQVGREVPITVDSFPQRTFRGRIEHLNDVGEFTPRRLTTTDERSHEMFGARVGLLDGEAELRAGMIAFMRVPKDR